MWKIGNVEIKNRVVLAPMAGFTSSTYRLLCKKMGVGLVVSEMVSDKALIYDSKKTFELLKFKEEERPIAIQLFGSDPDSMGKAAKFVEDTVHPDIIDINMGCPVPKIAIKSKAGSSLLKNPELIREIVASVVKSVSVPVTVKIRSGWDEEHINAPLVAKICEEAGASAIFIHGRTRKQGYSGSADLKIIKEVKDSVKIPVIGNGDIKSCYDAKKMIVERGVDAVMIGRATLGNPWLIKECVNYLEEGIPPKEVTMAERIALMKEHTLNNINEKGDVVGVLEMRSILMHYLKGLPNTKNLKLEICKCQTKDDLLKVIDEIKNR